MDRVTILIRNRFFKIAEKLNSELDIIPLLFGLLGLEQRLGAGLYTNDIDILIPVEFAIGVSFSMKVSII